MVDLTLVEMISFLTLLVLLFSHYLYVRVTLAKIQTELQAMKERHIHNERSITCLAENLSRHIELNTAEFKHFQEKSEEDHLRIFDKIDKVSDKIDQLRR